MCFIPCILYKVNLNLKPRNHGCRHLGVLAWYNAKINNKTPLQCYMENVVFCTKILRCLSMEDYLVPENIQ